MKYSYPLFINLKWKSRDMKVALAEIASIELLYQEEVSYVKVLHLKGDKIKGLFGLKTYKDNLFEYKGITKFDSMDKLANFMGKAICLTPNRTIVILPQIRIYSNLSFRSGEMISTAYKSNEEAEQEFNKLVQKYNLKVKENNEP